MDSIGYFFMAWTDPQLLFIVAAGTFAGIYIGAIPGLSVTMAASILISFTFTWHVNEALALITLQKKNDSTALGLCTSEDQVSCLRVYHAPHRYLYSPVENKVCVRMKERFVECSALESVESGFQAAVNLSRNEIRQWVQELEILH